MNANSYKRILKAVLLPIFTALVTFCGFGLGMSFAGSLSDLKTCNRALVGDAFTPETLTPTNFAKVGGSASVIVEKQQISAEGILEYVLKRTSESWHSLFGSAPNAPQGDPRSIVFIIGGELAHYFGISLVGDNRMIVPETSVINARIEKLNEKLIALGYEPIPVRFYTTGTELETDEDYNQKFAANGGIPISGDLQLYIHDISYHLASLVFPPDFTNHALQVAKAHQQFLEFVKSKSGEGTRNEKIIKAWSYDEMNSQQTHATDFLFGTLSEAVRERSIGLDDPKTNEIIFDLVNSYFSVNSKRTLQSILKSRIRNIEYVTSDPQDHISSEEFQSVLNSLLLEFVRKNPQYDWKQTIPNYNLNILFEQTKTRIHELKEAAGITHR